MAVVNLPRIPSASNMAFKSLIYKTGGSGHTRRKGKRSSVRKSPRRK